MQTRYGCQGENDAPPCGDNAPFAEYASCVRGCSARMLTGRACGDDSATLEQVPDLTARALETLERAVDFVGLTEHWAASICLFHARFGGPCLASEFVNTRPNPDPNATLDARLADAWPGDPVDEAVYTAAAERFWAQIDEHKLSRDVCARQICPDVEATLFDQEGSWTPKARDVSQVLKASAVQDGRD